MLFLKKLDNQFIRWKKIVKRKKRSLQEKMIEARKVIYNPTNRSYTEKSP